MGMIHIENRQKNQKIAVETLEKVAQRILNDSECPDAELSLLIVDDIEIQQINRDYLQRDKPTNVISFAMQEGEDVGLHPGLLGDVIISADTAARDAREADLPFESELYFLLLHGVLHLLGYDHERGTEEDARRMEAREAELFARIREEFL
ncbi:protein of unknown function UPF0054 [Syntrophotalea carbinolica DSM 2380]|uniref:Endoribonuclease YbeY n=1 Tax=Syntrophotalea carbinolica (strain DSM 2380 / NBRC 103641 / GraBd1) TaxID=338963 RepID=YBEY_SYNC1|nr:RecName: Full=Endoribonuclease YbeY [Syntrophotalea carbinolica DSM 2380]ABA88482.2 protein of unknown function UPF0054 [Syntrophotalea carbinolica DSM 2380]